MKQISILIKPASSNCNLRCKYCFYANVSSLREVESHGLMSKDTVNKMIDNVYVDLNDGDKLTIAFQGGEPTLAGLAYYEYVVACVEKQSKDVNVSYSIQTNGMLIDESWCIFLKNNNFLVGISADGPEIYHDRFRLDYKNQGTFKNVIKAMKLFDKYEIDYNVLCVLTDDLSNHPREVYEFIMSNKIKYIQFIPCLGSIDSQETNEYELTPQKFAYFYLKIFDLWMNTPLNNKFSVKLFDDLYNLLSRHQITACGILGRCQIQYVIESDGSVYPCDFYAIDDYKLGNIKNSSLKQLFNSRQAKEFLKASTYNHLSDVCNSCEYKRICFGGCRRLAKAKYVDEQIKFCGYKVILKEFMSTIDL